jgi:putative nucleotidyltransferase with HDIG domain
VLATLADQTAIVLENLNLYKNLQQVYLGVIKTLSMAVDAKDHYTYGHSQRVTEYVISMAEEMRLDPEMKKVAEAAAVIHDIGKIGIREEILLKPGRLTDDEFTEIKKHPVTGSDMVKPIEFLSALAPLIYYHHQHYNGGGYPDKITGEDIPLVARMITVADSYDAMVSDRPYRKGLPEETALKELKRCSGTQFDPDLVTIFLKIIRDKKAKMT